MHLVFTLRCMPLIFLLWKCFAYTHTHHTPFIIIFTTCAAFYIAYDIMNPQYICSYSLPLICALAFSDCFKKIISHYCRLPSNATTITTIITLLSFFPCFTNIHSFLLFYIRPVYKEGYLILPTIFVQIVFVGVVLYVTEEHVEFYMTPGSKIVFQ